MEDINIDVVTYITLHKMVSCCIHSPKSIFVDFVLFHTCIHVCMYVCRVTGVREGKALDGAQPAEGVHGRVMGEFLLSVGGGVSRRAAEPRTGPPLLPHPASRQPALRQPWQPGPAHRQHRPHRVLRPRTELPQVGQRKRRPSEIGQVEDGKRAEKRGQRQGAAGGGALPRTVQSDGDSRLLPGNDRKVYNRRAAQKGLLMTVVYVFVRSFV